MSNLTIISSAAADMTKEQLFRAACGTYMLVLDAINFDVAHGQVTRTDADKRLNELRDAEKGAVEALKELLKGDKNEKIVLDYLGQSNGFFRAWAACTFQDTDPLSPKYRRATKALFDGWKAAEQAYGRAGYRTISFDDFYSSMSGDDSAIRPSAIVKMAERRNADEEPVFHAVATQRKYTKLKI